MANEDPSEPAIASIFSRVSGFDLQACDVLAGRYDAELGFRPPNLETWVVRFGANARLDTLFLAGRGWLTGIWRAQSGRIFVSSIERKVHHYDPLKNSWETHPLPANVMGVWGLDDDYVFAWGLAEHATPAVFTWNGSAWRTVPAPGELVWQMHGIRRDLVFAVGDRGSISRWDGSRWLAMPSSATGTLASVFVAADDEVYACGGTELFAGSVNGWTKLLDAEAPLFTVFKWRETVYVGATKPVGLCTLDGRELVPLKPNIEALDVDVRGELLISNNTHIIHSADGKAFIGVDVARFEEMVANDAPSWR